MHVAFRRLFRVRVRHDWYADSQVREDDFEVVPTPSTTSLLEELGLRTRALPDGLTVYGEVEPGSAPPLLRRPLGPVSLRFAFELRAPTTPLLNITELPPFKPAQTIFCLDNLREDIASGRKHLSDSMAGARFGAAVTLVTRPAYTHTLGAPAATATVTIRDRFGATVATLEARSPDGTTPQNACPLDLASVPKVVPGRYRITDNRGGVSAIYYDPGLAASRPFAVIEIYTRTEALTPDGSDRVPASYRFLSGDTVTGLDPYFVQLTAIATTWRFIVTKKYANNSVTLASLAITGPVAFTRVLSGSRVVFTSTTAVRLSASRRGLKLIQQPPTRDVRDLPDPDLQTPLGKVPAVPNFVSDLFVYV